MNEKINAVYERLTPDENAVDAAVKKAMETKANPFPLKRALSFAASVAVVAAVTMTIAAVMNSRAKTAADSAGSFERIEVGEWIDGNDVEAEAAPDGRNIFIYADNGDEDEAVKNDSYGEENGGANYGGSNADSDTDADGKFYTIGGYPDGASGSSGSTSQSALDGAGVGIASVPIPEGVGAEPVIVSDGDNELTLTPIRMGFDGSFVTIVFSAESSGETNVTDYYFSPETAWNLYEGSAVSQARFTLDEKAVELTDSFVLLRDANDPQRYSGFMSFAVESSKEAIPVHISLPFLIAQIDDGESLGGYVLMPDDPIQFDFTVTRTDG